jgi:hypothetical protein
MRVLMLILASDDTALNREFQVRWRKYMNTNPAIHSYFYKADPNLDVPARLVDANTLMVRSEESLDTCYEKMLLAFDFFRPVLRQYTFIFRTNLSSFVVFPKYIEYLKTAPTTAFCSAQIDEDTITFPAGAGFTITPDLVERLVIERPLKFIQDDVTLGKALHSWGVTITPVERVNIYYQSEEHLVEKAANSKHYHYRLKSNTDRNRDLMLQDRLFELQYMPKKRVGVHNGRLIV